MELGLLTRARELAEIHGINFSQLVSMAMVELVERYETLSPEEKATALEVRVGRKPMSPEEYVKRNVERRAALNAYRDKINKGPTLSEMDEDE